MLSAGHQQSSGCWPCRHQSTCQHLQKHITPTTFCPPKQKENWRGPVHSYVETNVAQLHLVALNFIFLAKFLDRCDGTQWCPWQLQHARIMWPGCILCTWSFILLRVGGPIALSTEAVCPFPGGDPCHWCRMVSSPWALPLRCFHQPSAAHSTSQ